MTDVLISKIKTSIQQTRRDQVIIAGGVAANKYIRNEFKTLENEMSIKTYFPQLKYCGDNAAMIAFVGSMKSHGKSPSNKSNVRARWPLDDL